MTPLERAARIARRPGRAGLTAALLCAGLTGPPPAVAAQSKPRIEVVFRYDDFSSVSFTGFETRLLGVFQKTRTPLTVGVIPFPVAKNFLDPSPQPTMPLTEEKSAILREAIQAGIVEPALHGYSHQARPRPFWGQFSEFKGLGRDEQMRRLREGRDFLKTSLNHDIRIFIPPWDAADATTLDALQSLDFLGVSAGFDGGVVLVPESTSLKFLPATSDLPRFYESLRSARKSDCSSTVLVVLLRDADFSEVDGKRSFISLEAFAEMLTALSKQSDLSVVRMADVMSRPEYGPGLFVKNKKFVSAESLIYPWLTDLFNLNNGYYLCAANIAVVYPRAAKLLAAYVALVLIVCFAVAFRSGQWIFPKWPWSAAAALFLTFSVLVFLAYDIQRDADMTYKGMTGLLMFAGFLLGQLAALAWSWLGRRRRFEQGPLEEWRI